MPSAYTLLAQNGVKHIDVTKCEHCRKPFSMSAPRITKDILFDLPLKEVHGISPDQIAVVHNNNTSYHNITNKYDNMVISDGRTAYSYRSNIDNKYYIKIDKIGDPKSAKLEVQSPETVTIVFAVA
jgi:hypothetical protein